MQNANVLTLHRSGIFGYINYLVEKDRKTILDTLVNGEPGFVFPPPPSC